MYPQHTRDLALGRTACSWTGVVVGGCGDEGEGEEGGEGGRGVTEKEGHGNGSAKQPTTKTKKMRRGKKENPRCLFFIMFFVFLTKP